MFLGAEIYLIDKNTKIKIRARRNDRKQRFVFVFQVHRDFCGESQTVDDFDNVVADLVADKRFKQSFHGFFRDLHLNAL